ALRTAVKVARVGVEVARSINILEMAITPLASTTSFLTSVAFIGHLLPPRAAPKARRPAHTIGTPDPAQFAAFTAVKEAKRPAINQLRESRLSAHAIRSYSVRRCRGIESIAGLSRQESRPVHLATIDVKNHQDRARHEALVES